MAIHNEYKFEGDICDYLAANGWAYDRKDDARYDAARALYPDDVLYWVKTAYPDAWATLQKNHGTLAADTLLNRLRDQMNQLGTLDVLRSGFDVMGVKQKIKMAEFKPALAINADIIKRYEQNRLRVIRQLHYSTQNNNSIDVVLFLNGLPVATVELKSNFTQSIEAAVEQYKTDRDPAPKGKAIEPLLTFLSGALVHFAVSNDEVRMTTRLEGPKTRFLPFNQGNDGGAGNPPNPNGHPTAYLWEDVWARESWLEIIGRYCIAPREVVSQKVKQMIFPRYHQLVVTRRLQEAILKDKAGTRYLIQHSAGSGKTNSIAWTAHFLAELHDNNAKKVFDTILVISDRNVIDRQLQEALFSFARQTGVVELIDDDAGSKSEKLATALNSGKKIVVCTIQTFPHVLKAAREQISSKKRRYAVIADEAHSSQAGEAAAKLKELLSKEEIASLDDGGEVSTEDILAAQMGARADEGGLTFIAYTATPKNKTMELFGTRPNPDQKPGPDNVPHPFHVYSMRQAIEEKFILDVLQNYTTYKMAFRLAHNGKTYDEAMVDRSAAMKKVMGWVSLHPHNIAQKVQIIVEHFREHVAPLLAGKAKAMVVVGSRVEAVRWKISIEKYIESQGYQIGTLVAFSGEVNDPESGPDPFTEHSTTLNPRLKKRDIAKAFDGDDFHILLVANKFQTGFDQPLLCGMYVDKKLSGIQAVQTLSRLNRAHAGKDTTYIVDFVNDEQDILKAFKTYFTTAELSSTSDPNLVLNLRAKLDAQGYYDDGEVDRVINAVYRPHQSQAEVVAALTPVVDRLLKKYKAAAEAHAAAVAMGDAKGTDAAKAEMGVLELFKADMATFVRLYTFLSQIFDYANTDIEKRSIFYKHLLPLLVFGRERTDIDLSGVVMTHHALKIKARGSIALTAADKPRLDPMSAAGSGQMHEKQKALLREIIEQVNELFDPELTEGDKLQYVEVIKGKLLESSTLRLQAQNNTKEQFGSSPDLPKELQNAVMDALAAHATLSKQALGSEKVQRGLLHILLTYSNLWEALRTPAG